MDDIQHSTDTTNSNRFDMKIHKMCHQKLTKKKPITNKIEYTKSLIKISLLFLLMRWMKPCLKWFLRWKKHEYLREKQTKKNIWCVLKLNFDEKLIKKKFCKRIHKILFLLIDIICSHLILITRLPRTWD